MDSMNRNDFKREIYQYFSLYKRTLPWRYENDPYKILVSEVMLQQTQVSRVLYKYKEWLEKFPTVESLAKASLRDVLVVWQGLGYNRRGKYLREAAERIVSDKRYEFTFLRSKESRNQGIKKEIRISATRGALIESSAAQVRLFQELPGIGQATAAAIVAYAFNKPVVFIETNIRAVYLYFFFKKESHISDRQIAELVEKTLDFESPRDWYYALTDYGNMLKNKEKFKNTQSKHYLKQSRFEGSRRQLRSRVLFLISSHRRTLKNLLEETGRDEHEVVSVLVELEHEAFITQKEGSYDVAHG